MREPDSDGNLNVMFFKKNGGHFQFKTARDPFQIIRNLSFRLLQEELTPCYAKLSGATVDYAWISHALPPKVHMLKPIHSHEKM